MHIGLIGGIGPAATDFYYRWLIKAFQSTGRELELTIVHADTPTLLAHLAQWDEAGQAAIFERLTHRLKAAGARCVAVTSIAGHFCIEAFSAVSPLPVIDLLSSVATRIRQQGYETVGIIGTKAIMESGMYGRLSPLNIVAPGEAMLERVHQAYVDMATAGIVTEAQRQIFFDSVRDLCANRGAQAVLLGGTDLFLAFDGQDCGYRVIDCARLHLEDIAKAAAR